VIVPGFVRYVDAGLPRTAYDYFMGSLARAPQEAHVLAHVAAVLELAGRDEYARIFRERVVRISPADARVRARFARALHRSYAFTESEHQARVALVLARATGMQGTPAEQGAAYRDAGLALLQTGEPRRAAQVLEQALALAPSMVDTHADVALAHLESGDFGAATRHLEHAVAAAPADRARFTGLLALLEEHAANGAAPDAAPRLD
jgi:tetratricopeptide (TPR) repeat protein